MLGVWNLIEAGIFAIFVLYALELLKVSKERSTGSCSLPGPSAASPERSSRLRSDGASVRGAPCSRARP